MTECLTSHVYMYGSLKIQGIQIHIYNSATDLYADWELGMHYVIMQVNW